MDLPAAALRAAQMSRKAETNRRAPRRRRAKKSAAEPLPPQRKIPLETNAAQDSDFGLCMFIAPAFRRRTDA
jgi:hypothetical protein